MKEELSEYKYRNLFLFCILAYGSQVLDMYGSLLSAMLVSRFTKSENWHISEI